jgi:hypothetical protein
MPHLPGDLYTDAPLTRAAVAGFQKAENFIAPFMVPRLIVDKPTGIYYKWLLADINRSEMQRRGDLSPAAVASFAKEDATYRVPTESLAYELNDTARKAAASALDPSKVIPKMLGYKALLRLEKMLADKLFLAANWYRVVTGAGSDSVTEGTTSTRKRFSDTSTDPIKAVLQEIEFQSKLTGFEPGAFAFGRKAWTSFRTNPYVLATLTGTTGIVRTAPATTEEVARLLDLKWVGVSKAIYNTAGQGLAASNARIVPEDSALLFYRGASGSDPGTWNDDMPVAATCQVWAEGAGNNEGLRIRRFRVETAGAGGSDHSEIDTFRDYGVVTPEMGTLFEDMTA